MPKQIVVPSALDASQDCGFNAAVRVCGTLTGSPSSGQSVEVLADRIQVVGPSELKVLVCQLKTRWCIWMEFGSWRVSVCSKCLYRKFLDSMKNIDRKQRIRLWVWGGKWNVANPSGVPVRSSQDLPSRIRAPVPASEAQNERPVVSAETLRLRHRHPAPHSGTSP